MITAIPSIAVDEGTEIEIPELTGSEIVVSARGIPPEVQAGKLIYRWAGFSHSVQLDNGSFYPLQERVGDYALDAGQSRHGRIIGSSGRGLVAGVLVDLWELINGANSAYYLDGENDLKITLGTLDYDFVVEISLTTIGAENTFKLQIGEQENVTPNISLRTTYKLIRVKKEGNDFTILINGVAQAGTISAVADYSNKEITISGDDDVPVIVRWIRFRRLDDNSSFIEILGSDEVKPKNQIEGLTVEGLAKPISIPMRWDSTQQVDALLTSGSRMNLDEADFVFANRIVNQHDQEKYNSPIQTDSGGKWIAMARSFLAGHINEINVVRVLNRL